MNKNKITKISLILALTISFLSYPPLSYGKVKEKAILYNAATGHDHDGSTGGKIVDSGDIMNTPAGNIAATDTQAAIDELDSEKIASSEKGAINGVASLDGSAEVLAIQLPAIAITDVNVCGSQVCQLALTAEEGDICVRTDEDKSYIHNGGIVGDMTDWTLLLSTGLVTSIQSQIGDVTLDHSDLNNIGADNHHTQTTSFATLVDSATDAQIPNDITIDYSTSSGDSDTVDSKHFIDIQADTTSQISSHVSSASAHHSSTSDSLSLTPSLITIVKPLAGNNAIDLSVTGDSGIRLSISGGGTLWFGDGTSPVDTNIYRASANVLKTDDTFTVAGVASTITYATTTKAITIPGAGGFVPTTSNGVAVASNAITSNAISTTNYAVAGINLPVGATVTRLDVYGFTNDSGDTCTMILDSRDSAGASTSLASCTFADGVDSCNDTSISNATIDSSRGYHLVADMSSDESAGQAGVYYVKITYTVTNVGQTL